MKKNMLVRSKNRRLLKYYFKSYFFILIIPLIFSSIYYLRSINTIKENAVLENEIALKQVSQVLEKQLEIMCECCDVVASNYYVRLFSSYNQTDKTAKPFDIVTLQRNLPNYSMTNELIDNYYIFFNNSSMVINNSISYSYADFYKLNRHKEGQKWEDWLEERESNFNSYYRLQPCQNWVNTYTRESSENLSFLYPLPSYSGRGGSVLLLIDKSALLNIITPINKEDGIWYIQDSSGEILIQGIGQKVSADSIQIIMDENYSVMENLHGVELIYEKEKMLVTRICNENEKYIYTMLQPKATVLQQADFTFLLLLGTLAVSFVFGIMACIAASMQNSMPIKSILETLSVTESDSKMDIFGGIQKAISDINHTNDMMSQALLEQLPYLRNAFLSGLLAGNFESDEEAATMADYVHFHTGCAYVVIIIRFQNVTDNKKENLTILNTYKLAISEILDKEFDNLLYTDTGEMNLTVLCSVDNKRQERINNQEEFIESFVAMLHGRLPAHIFNILLFYAGTGVDSLTKVVRSYESANSLLFLEPDGQKWPIILYRKLKSDDTSYYYPREIDNKIMNTALMGKKDMLHSLLSELIRINLIERKLPHYVQEIFISDLQSCFIRTVEQSNLSDEKQKFFLDELEECCHSPFLKRMQIIIGLYTDLCSYVSEVKQKQSSSVADEVILFINRNYMNPDLSLCMVADAIHRNQTYLSDRFKQLYGKNFSAYVEEVRMENAKRFVVEDRLSTTDISSAVGYTSVNSFCRSFKRYTGYSAMQYRNKSKAENC